MFILTTIAKLFLFRKVAHFNGNSECACSDITTNTGQSKRASTHPARLPTTLRKLCLPTATKTFTNDLNMTTNKHSSILVFVQSAHLRTYCKFVDSVFINETANKMDTVTAADFGGEAI